MSILLVNGNAERIPLADESVHAVVTSPPYYGLRKYAIDGDAEIGLEDTPEAYLDRMVAVFREVRRVLRADGVAWVNMGDSYAHGEPGGGSVFDNGRDDGRISYDTDKARGRNKRATISPGYKPLDLMNIPARLVLALQADGWYHRSTIIWAKPNPMPESVSGWRWERHKVKVGKQMADVPSGWRSELNPDKQSRSGTHYLEIAEWRDCPGCAKCAPNNGLILRRGSWRPTTAHEYIFMLTKTSDYFADGEAVREENSPTTGKWGKSVVSKTAQAQGDGRHGTTGFMGGEIGHDEIIDRYYTSGRNARTVWDFPTQPYPGSHFATYPEELPRRCLKASISEQGCCPICGSQWARVVEKGEPILNAWSTKGPGDYNFETQSRNQIDFASGSTLKHNREYITHGFLPTCTCGAKHDWDLSWLPDGVPGGMRGAFVPCKKCEERWYFMGETWEDEPIGCVVKPIVLDPFCGSGTTGIVARELGAHFVGLDLSYPYLHDQARDRLGLTALDAWAQGKGKQDGKVISDLPLFEVKA